MNIDGKEYENESFLYYFAYYNKKVRFWNQVFTSGNVPPAAFAKGVARSILVEKSEALKQHLDECDLYFIGRFDDTTGVFDVLDRPQLLLNCSDYFGGENNG